MSSSPAERQETFSCFGAHCTVIVGDPVADAEAAVSRARVQLEKWHERFSRFLPSSEICAVNDDSRSDVPVSALMARLIASALRAARLTGGLVDPTLLGELERAGYRSHLEPFGDDLAAALRDAPPRATGRAAERPDWHEVSISRRTGVLTRPPGVRLDLNGIAKGVFADELGARLRQYERFAIDCAGDVLVGGRGGVLRRIEVASPFDDAVIHTFELSAGAAATSGIGRRSWRGDDGAPAHHVLDPRTGRPAYTGLVQVTALAPTGAEAEMRSKAALLSGPGGAEGWLAHGGLVVLEDGTARAVAQSAGPGSSAQGTTTASSSGELRATTYSAGSTSDGFSRMCVSRGGT
jgi:thiamine biosynthesis lipoprotein